MASSENLPRASAIPMRHNRRALGVINQNIAGAGPYPCLDSKRGIPKKDAISGKATAHRPITRKFAVQLANSQQPSSEKETDSQNQTISGQNNKFGDCIYVDEEGSPAANNEHVPMTFEIPMEEVEMEDIEEEEEEEEEMEPIMDIDGRDKKNPLAVVDYVEDIYAYHRKMENYSCVCPDYMLRQHDINEKMRSILIDWLIEVHNKFDLMPETLFLTVSIIDRFLALQSVVKKKLQLVGLVAMLLACKYEEVSVPVVGDLILISDKAYTRDEVLEMETLMLNSLQFNMSLPTPYVFIRRFLKAAESDKKLERLSYYLMELALVEYETLKYPPSLLAAAAIFTAQCSLYGFKQWTRTCQWHSNYSQHHLLECSRLMVGFHQRAATGKLTGVYRKYSTSKLGYTSKYEPALFLISSKIQQE
ncbi:hypothetical protein SAY87_028496 [Trapa incisa]|uniref:Cyclin N-terminal domain-containing protein n=1 Tax=Trapa incisa TaxID=236973 RepID=A0AAN7QPB7_9MYRT|nr:hypothetical protein SAY87_028496 [Trapa incisa]